LVIEGPPAGCSLLNFEGIELEDLLVLPVHPQARHQHYRPVSAV
jgi:hypothetical protein